MKCKERPRLYVYHWFRGVEGYVIVTKEGYAFRLNEENPYDAGYVRIEDVPGSLREILFLLRVHPTHPKHMARFAQLADALQCVEQITILGA